MKRLFALLALVCTWSLSCTETDMIEPGGGDTTELLPSVDEIPNNQIWYTTTDGEAIDISLDLWDEITYISAILTSHSHTYLSIKIKFRKIPSVVFSGAFPKLVNFYSLC